jgi:hypothetical protein
MARLTSTGIQFDLADPANAINSYYWLYPQGTKKLFYQASAPTGWTQVTTANASGATTNINDLTLRVVNSTTTGGSWGSGGVQGQIGSSFSTVLGGTSPNLFQTYSGTFSVGIVVPLASIVGNTTLALENLPNHTHSTFIGATGGANSTPFSNAGARLRSGTTATSGMIESTGGGSHRHPFSGSVTFTNVLSEGDFAMGVQYIDVILCSLD